MWYGPDVLPNGTRSKVLSYVVLSAAGLGLINAATVANVAATIGAFVVCALAGLLLATERSPVAAEAPTESKRAPSLPSLRPAAAAPASSLRPQSAAAMTAYDLHEQVGVGSMGEVWRATHRLLGRASAIKTIKGVNVGPEDIARFYREARATAELTSPHTIDIYDFGETEGGFFYVMEYLQGLDLQRLVTRHGAMPASRVVHVLIQACHSLAEAHSHGVVHRDIKPANLMLCRYGLDLDFIKLLDFGLAKSDGTGSREGALTKDGTVLGTAAYIAPESLRGSAKVDGRADLYALGAIGFWLLTGRLLFTHTRALEMARAHLQEIPPRSASVAPFPVPPALDDLIANCLEKEPDARPQTAEALRDRLLAIDVPAWTQAEAKEWWQGK